MSRNLQKHRERRSIRNRKDLSNPYYRPRSDSQYGREMPRRNRREPEGRSLVHDYDHGRYAANRQLETSGRRHDTLGSSSLGLVETSSSQSSVGIQRKASEMDLNFAELKDPDWYEPKDKKERRSWFEQVEEEENRSRLQNIQVEQKAVNEGSSKRCFDQHEGEDFKDPSISKSRPSHRRHDSLVSNNSSLSSSETSDTSNIKKMSSTPRFTHSELQTPEVQAIITRRKKQIEYGKNQDCYSRYLQLVPRRKRTQFHPRTPDIHRNYSRRGFDTLVKIWKKQLHAWEVDEKKQVDVSSELAPKHEDPISTDAVTESVSIKKEEKQDFSDDSKSNYDANFPAFRSKTEPVDDKIPTSSLDQIDFGTSSGFSSLSGIVIKTEKEDDWV